MFLQKLRITSNASRNIKTFKSLWYDKKVFKPLNWRRLSNAGSNVTGRIVVRTKSSFKRRLLYPIINYSFRQRILSLNTTFRLIPFQNKLVSLAFLSSGAITYLPTTSSFSMFGFNYFRSQRTANRDSVSNPNLALLGHIARLSKISLLELFPGAGIQYVRSSGSTAKLIKLDFNSHTAVVQLPSGVRKVFSVYSLASQGGVSLRDKRLTACTKAGFWKTFGKKSTVRGVAMNPIDHPHGGRTKAIKYPRTPWGKTTKFK